jgi:hypothetical protein
MYRKYISCIHPPLLCSFTLPFLLLFSTKFGLFYTPVLHCLSVYSLFKLVFPWYFTCKTILCFNQSHLLCYSSLHFSLYWYYFLYCVLLVMNFALYLSEMYFFHLYSWKIFCRKYVSQFTNFCFFLLEFFKSIITCFLGHIDFAERLQISLYVLLFWILLGMFLLSFICSNFSMTLSIYIKYIFLIFTLHEIHWVLKALLLYFSPNCGNFYLVFPHVLFFPTHCPTILLLVL